MASPWPARAAYFSAYCSKCQRRKVVDYHVEPVKLCSSCFDVEAEKAKVRYSFANVTATLARRRHGTSVVKHGSGC
jgi:hypothetical protein